MIVVGKFEGRLRTHTTEGVELYWLLTRRGTTIEWDCSVCKRRILVGERVWKPVRGRQWIRKNRICEECGGE